MSIYHKVAKKMAKDLADLEDQRVKDVLEDMTCKHCRKLLTFDEHDYYCDNALVDHIIEV